MRAKENYLFCRIILNKVKKYGGIGGTNLIMPKNYNAYQPRLLWLLATAPGYFLSWALGNISVGELLPQFPRYFFGFDLISDFLVFAGGILVGLCQYLILRQWLHGALWWIVPTVIVVSASFSDISVWPMMVLGVLCQMLLFSFNQRPRESRYWVIWILLIWFISLSFKSLFAGFPEYLIITFYVILNGLATGGALVNLFISKKIRHHVYREPHLLYLKLKQKIEDFFAEKDFQVGTKALKEATECNVLKAGKLYTKACQCFDNYVEKYPDSFEALAGWGASLAELAKIASTNQEAERLYNLAYQKFQDSFEKNFQQPQMLLHWGRALGANAAFKTGKGMEQLYLEAYEKIHLATEDISYKTRGLLSWGNTLLTHGRRETGHEAEELYSKAEEKFQRVLEIDFNNQEAIVGLGFTYIERAKLRSGKVADQFLAFAYDRVRGFLVKKPDEPEALLLSGVILLRKAVLKIPGEDNEFLFAEAWKKFVKADSLVPGLASYYMACYNALSGRDHCLNLLEKSLAEDKLPPLEYITNDGDLNNVKTEKWFVQFLKDLRKEKYRY